MRYNILRCACLVTLVMFCGTTACRTAARDPNISHYTCPMHPQVVSEEPGECPICHMTLVPVMKGGTTHEHEGHEAEGHPDHSRGDEKRDMKGVTIPPDVSRLSGITTAVVKKGAAVREIRTFGRVAFDPQLAVAQSEYLQAFNMSVSFREGARRRLKVLGMSDEEIAGLDKTRRPFTGVYLPESGEAVWVYATIYDNDFAEVSSGMEAEVMIPTVSGRIYRGVVRGMDPVADMTTRTHTARIEVVERDDLLMPGMAVDVTLRFDLGERILAPKSAVIVTGLRQLAYAALADDYFEARELVLGPELGDSYVILDGLADGERVVDGALFLVDAEARLRGGVVGSHDRHKAP